MKGLEECLHERKQKQDLFRRGVQPRVRKYCQIMKPANMEKVNAQPGGEVSTGSSKRCPASGPYLLGREPEKALRRPFPRNQAKAGLAPSDKRNSTSGVSWLGGVGLESGSCGGAPGTRPTTRSPRFCLPCFAFSRAPP